MDTPMVSRRRAYGRAEGKDQAAQGELAPRTRMTDELKGKGRGAGDGPYTGAGEGLVREGACRER